MVYAKAPFSGPEDVLEYAARYTHRVAISNDRLLDVQDEKVQFRWKDYRDGNRKKVMTVTAEEFIRRFLLHVLPEGFQRIRHYGFLANRYREQKLARCRELLKMPPPEPKSQEKKDYRDQYEELTGRRLSRYVPFVTRATWPSSKSSRPLQRLQKSLIPHDHHPHLGTDLPTTWHNQAPGLSLPDVVTDW